MFDMEKVLEAFVEAARLAGLSLKREHLKLETFAPPHHQRPELPAGKQAVYVFVLGSRCVKVGKVGAKSGARFTHQHYGFSARSTLARSIVGDRARVAKCLGPERLAEVMALSEKDVGSWIEANTTRVNVYMDATHGALALNLLEAFVQCRLQPLFEGAAGVDEPEA